MRSTTWAALAAELIYLPLSFSLTTQKIAWLTMSALHLAILGRVQFADLTIGMLLVHWFTWDPRWLAWSTQAQVRVRVGPKLEPA